MREGESEWTLCRVCVCVFVSVRECVRMVRGPLTQSSAGYSALDVAAAAAAAEEELLLDIRMGVSASGRPHET
jgi:hypothetical protein